MGILFQSDQNHMEGGYICQSDIFYARPKRAQNTYGQWKIIVNLADDDNSGAGSTGPGVSKYSKYSQTVR